MNFRSDYRNAWYNLFPMGEGPNLKSKKRRIQPMFELLCTLLVSLASGPGEDPTKGGFSLSNGLEVPPTKAVKLSWT